MSKLILPASIISFSLAGPPNTQHVIKSDVSLGVHLRRQTVPHCLYKALRNEEYDKYFGAMATCECEWKSCERKKRNPLTSWAPLQIRSTGRKYLKRLQNCTTQRERATLRASTSASMSQLSLLAR